MLVVFDLDGTLLDTLRDLTDAASELAEVYGNPRLDEAGVAAMVGDGAARLVERIFASAGQTAPPEALGRFLDIYEAHAFNHSAPYPGVPEMLERLSATHRLALLTNKPEASARALLRHTGIDRWIEACVFGDGAWPRKPDPAGLQWLVAHAGLEPGQTIMVGDSVMDVEAARAAGTRLAIACYGFGYPRIPAGAVRADDLLLDRPWALVGHLDALTPRNVEEAP